MTSKSESLPAYVATYAALLGLTALTVGAAFVDFGKWNTLIALTIAIAKAILVILFFMHLLHSTSLVKLIFSAAILWLAILLGITFSDYLMRWYLPGGQTKPAWVQKDASHFVNKTSPFYEPENIH